MDKARDIVFIFLPAILTLLLGGAVAFGVATGQALASEVVDLLKVLAGYYIGVGVSKATS